jgi:hypothetical protein
MLAVLCVLLLSSLVQGTSANVLSTEGIPLNHDVARIVLSEARLLSILPSSHSEILGPSFEVRWTLPPIAREGEVPIPLLYSVLAEWRAGPQSRNQRWADTRSHPSSLRVCDSVHVAISSKEGKCVIPSGVLLSGVEVTLRVLTECDHKMMHQTMFQTSIRAMLESGLPFDASDMLVPEFLQCASSLSAPLSFTPPAALSEPESTLDDKQMISPTFRRPGSAKQSSAERRRLALDATKSESLQQYRRRQKAEHEATLETRLKKHASILGQYTRESQRSLQDDAPLRIALCSFFNMTGGLSWTHSDGWCSSASVCEWFGVQCDAATNQTILIGLQLPNNNLVLVDPVKGDINFLWTFVPHLANLQLSSNGLLGNLDLTLLTQLEVLKLDGWNSPIVAAPPHVSVLTLPPISALSYVDISDSGLLFDTKRTPLLQTLIALYNAAPWELSSMTLCPQLIIAKFRYSMLNSSLPDPLGSGLSGGALTQHVLQNLYKTNPVIQWLEMSNTPLVFGPTSSTGDSNWPRIVSPTLTKLFLIDLPQLYTPALGPDPLWLSDLPSLTTLTINLGSLVVLSTETFRNATGSFEIIDVATTTLLGDFKPLYRMSSLNSLVLDFTSLTSTLPSNIASIWPKLVTFRASSSQLFGTLPAFDHLPALHHLDVSANSFSGPVPVNLFEGSTKVTECLMDNK